MLIIREFQFLHFSSVYFNAKNRNDLSCCSGYRWSKSRRIWLVETILGYILRIRIFTDMVLAQEPRIQWELSFWFIPNKRQWQNILNNVKTLHFTKLKVQEIFQKVSLRNFLGITVPFFFLTLFIYNSFNVDNEYHIPWNFHLKFFSKKLLGHDVFSSVVLWVTKSFLKNLWISLKLLFPILYYISLILWNWISESYLHFE